jgi:hypothetical protein
MVCSLSNLTDLLFFDQKHFGGKRFLGWSTHRLRKAMKANMAKLDMQGSSSASKPAQNECVKLGIKLRIPTPPESK